MGRDNGQFTPDSEAAFRRPGVRIEAPTELIVPGRPELSVERFAAVPETTRLGKRDLRFDIPTDMGPFHVLPDYVTPYDKAVTGALGSLYTDYNTAFRPLVEANTEWDTDYQYAKTADGTPINYFVQIDMVGLPKDYRDATAQASPSDVKESLRGGIFEIENSLAMYGLLENLFPRDGKPSRFKEEFRAGLDEIRERTGKSIALLAVTDEKAEAMRTSEFGKKPGEPLTDQEVHDLTGFDAFFGPSEFAELVDRNGGDSPYLLYARTSEPVAKLKKPGLDIDHPLLKDDDLRRVIKANAITFNIDNPAWGPDHPGRINDTKEYMEPMGMGLTIASPDDVFKTVDGTKKGDRPTTVLTDQMAEHLIGLGFDPALVAANDVRLHAKPLKAAYGCYGHTSGTVRDKDFRSELRRGIKDRGLYVVQPAMTIPRVTDEATGQDYMYIDRNFMSYRADGPRFMSGFRSLMPLDTNEAKQGRVHGSKDTHWAEVAEAA